MESRKTTYAPRTDNLSVLAQDPTEAELVRKRLDWLLNENEKTAQMRRFSERPDDEFEAAAMSRPLDLQQTFSYFGLFLGIFPPAAMFLRIASDTRVEGWVIGIMLIINLISAVVGFFSGKIVGKLIGTAERSNWFTMTFFAGLIGLVWGIVTGGAAGVVFFGIGAIFGAVLGAGVGLAALPSFTILHRLVRRGENIELKQFLPLAFGVTFVICGLILGL